MGFQKDNASSRYFHFGVREHAMAAICNGMFAHGGVRWALGFIVFPCSGKWVLLCFPDLRVGFYCASLYWELGFIVFPWPESWVLLCFTVLGSGFYSLLLYLFRSNCYYYCTTTTPDPSARPSWTSLATRWEQCACRRSATWASYMSWPTTQSA